MNVKNHKTTQTGTPTNLPPRWSVSRQQASHLDFESIITAESWRWRKYHRLGKTCNEEERLFLSGYVSLCFMSHVVKSGFFFPDDGGGPPPTFWMPPLQRNTQIIFFPDICVGAPRKRRRSTGFDVPSSRPSVTAPSGGGPPPARSHPKAQPHPHHSFNLDQNIRGAAADSL